MTTAILAGILIGCARSPGKDELKSKIAETRTNSATSPVSVASVSFLCRVDRHLKGGSLRRTYFYGAEIYAGGDRLKDSDELAYGFTDAEDSGSWIVSLLPRNVLNCPSNTLVRWFGQFF